MEPHGELPVLAGQALAWPGQPGMVDRMVTDVGHEAFKDRLQQALRGRRAVLAVPAALGLVLVTGTAAFAAVSLTRVSADIYTDTQAQHRTEVEPDVFAFGATIVSAFQVGRVLGGGASNIGWATSRDGGATWSHGYLPGITGHGGGPGSAFGQAMYAPAGGLAVTGGSRAASAAHSHPGTQPAPRRTVTAR